MDLQYPVKGIDAGENVPVALQKEIRSFVNVKKQKTVGRKVGLGLYAVVPHRDAQFIFFPAEFGQFDPVKTAEVRVVRTAGKTGNLSVDPHGIVAVCGNPQKNPSGSFCPETALEIHIGVFGFRVPLPDSGTF